MDGGLRTKVTIKGERAMSIFVENKFTNLGLITRVSHVLLAKAVAIFSAYGAIHFGAFVGSAWIAGPLLLSAYLLFTGLTGWDPLIALDNHLKRRQRGQSTRRNLNSLARGV